MNLPLRAETPKLAERSLFRGSSPLKSSTSSADIRRPSLVKSASASSPVSQKSFKSRQQGCPNAKLLSGIVSVASATVSDQNDRSSCRRTNSTPLSRDGSRSSVRTNPQPQRKLGDVKPVVINKAPVGLHNVAAAKLLGRTWQHRQKQAQAQQQALELAKADEAQTPQLLMKKYKKKKHSLSSPSLGKYSPLLLRKAWQQKDLGKLDDFNDEQLEEDGDFSDFWNFDFMSTPHAEARLRDGRENPECFQESRKKKYHNGSPVFESSSLPGSVANVLQLPQHKQKKKSIISSFSLSQKDFQPKKLIAAKKISTISSNNHHHHQQQQQQILCRRQPVKKSRKSFFNLSMLIPSALKELDEGPEVSKWQHCGDNECCCHQKRCPGNECIVCKNKRKQSSSRKKSSILSKIPLNSAKLQLRHKLMGKSALRVNSEPILGHRLASTKLDEGKMTVTEKKRQGGSRFNLMTRKDSGLNKHPAKEKVAENTSKSIFSMASRSLRRHSAPPVQPKNIELNGEFTVTEFIDAGAINTTVMKGIRKKQIDLSKKLRNQSKKPRLTKQRRRRCCWCGNHKESVEVSGEGNDMSGDIKRFRSFDVVETATFYLSSDSNPELCLIKIGKLDDHLNVHKSDRGEMWLGSISNPAIPDPENDRNFPAFWMETVDKLLRSYSKKQISIPDSRLILRRLDRFLIFPEESAIMLRDFEYELIDGSTVFDLISCISSDLTLIPNPHRLASLERFHKIVSHFYMVTEWIVHVIISQGSRSGRKSVVNCLLRLAQVSWNIGNLNGVMEILLGLRSPSLKPLWLSFNEGDQETLIFSNLFNNFFACSSEGYHLQVKKISANFDGFSSSEIKPEHIKPLFVPAYLQHIYDLMFALQTGKSSSLFYLTWLKANRPTDISQNKSNEEIDQNDCRKKSDLNIMVLADFKGENRFVQRSGPDGLNNPVKLVKFQSSIQKAEKALSTQRISSQRPTTLKRKKLPSITSQTSQMKSNLPKHDVVIAEVPRKLEPTVEILRQGATVLHLDPETHQVTSVLLKLEPCHGTITWSRPPWNDPRRYFGSPTSHECLVGSLSTGATSNVNIVSTNSNGHNITITTDIESSDCTTIVSPGLRLKYTNRSGESLAYSEEGYIDLNHVKSLTLSSNIVAFPEEVRTQVQRCFQGVVEPRALKIIFGSTLSDNKVLTFLSPPRVANAWMEMLQFLTKSIKIEDPRMVWLKNQYLFFYYQDDLCMGPLAADAITVFGGRSWSLTGMLKGRGNNKGNWKGAQNPRLKKKSYSNIHTINDRGIHEIFESFGGSAAGSSSNTLSASSAPTSPWTTPKVARKSVVTIAPSIERPSAGKMLSPLQHLDSFALEDNGKFKSFPTGSVTHGSELTFLEFLDLFKSFSLRLRNDIRTLFANHSVCNAISPEKDTSREKLNLDFEKRRAVTCSLTRNSIRDSKDSKEHADKIKIYDAISAASIFHNVAREATSRSRVLPLDAFQHFLNYFQKENFSEEEVKQLIEIHEPDPILRSRHQFSFNGFARYLMDTNNSAILDGPVAEDLDQPLSRYYIATSHNTYLSGHQLKGQSSVQLYREILLSGCRCVELDCWDGDDGNPIIYHGHTLTTKISFRDVVQTIATYAFETSPLPVILSIENRCSVGQQQKMATIFKELLGDRLVTAPVCEFEQWLPSPNQLRHKFVLKNKKIRHGIIRESIYRASAMDDSVEVDEEYDSDFGEEHFDDESVEDIPEQNVSTEEFHQQTVRRPRTLSISPSVQLSTIGVSNHTQHQRSSVFATVAPTLSMTMSNEIGSGDSSGGSPNSKQHKKQNLQIASELSDLIVYCQSVKFKGFRKTAVRSSSANFTDSPASRRKVMMETSSAQSPGTTNASIRKTAGGKNVEATLSSSATTPSQANILRTNTSLAQEDILTNPIYQCVSLPENRAKNLCRKQPQKMLEHTELQLVRVYPAGMRIDSSNFNPVPFWSCGIQMAAMNYQTTTDTNMHLHNAFFAGTNGYVLRPSLTWNPTHVLYKRFAPSNKSQDGLHPTNITLTIVSGQYVCRENYMASAFVEVEVIGLPRDCSKYKTKLVTRNALNPIWEETFELEISLPELALIRFNVIEGASNAVTAQRVVPVNRLRPGYRHLRLHNEHDQQLPLSQLFICCQIDSDVFLSGTDGRPLCSEQLGRKRMSFLVIHEISDQTPYAILKVPEDATTRDVIKQAIAKAGGLANLDHDYVLLEENVSSSTSSHHQQRMIGMEEMPLQVRKADTKFVLKKVGQDPSWRARLGNLISDNRAAEFESQHLSQQSGNSSKDDSFDCLDDNDDLSSDNNPEEAFVKRNNSEQFLVCVFNVSSKVSYSILQVPKSSTAHEVIALALHKSRRDDHDVPENFVLVEETDAVGNTGASGGNNAKSNSSKRQRRILEAKENVYLAQLTWKGGARLVLEEKTRIAFHPMFDNAHHPNVCETQSDPLGGSNRLMPGSSMTSKMSPNLRRHSRNIVSNVRKLSRSFYGGSLGSSESPSPSFPSSTLKPEIPAAKTPTFEPDVSITTNPMIDTEIQSESTSPQFNSRKVSKINLKKLRIW